MCFNLAEGRFESFLSFCDIQQLSKALSHRLRLNNNTLVDGSPRPSGGLQSSWVWIFGSKTEGFLIPVGFLVCTASILEDLIDGFGGRVEDVGDFGGLRDVVTLHVDQVQQYSAPLGSDRLVFLRH